MVRFKMCLVIMIIILSGVLSGKPWRAKGKKKKKTRKLCRQSRGLRLKALGHKQPYLRKSIPVHRVHRVHQNQSIDNPHSSSYFTVGLDLPRFNMSLT